MLAEPHGCRCAVCEPNHGMFPISYMISQELSIHRVSLVEGVEIHVEGVHDPIIVVVHYDGAGLGSCCCMRHGVRKYAI